MAEQNELVTILGVSIAKDAFSNVDKFHSKISSMMQNLIVATGILKGAQMFKGFVDSAINGADALQKVSEKTGLSTDALQEWGYAASRAGLDANAVQGDLTKLATQFGIFGAGAGRAEERLLRLADTMHGMSTDKAARLGSMYGLSSDTSMLLAKEGRGGIQQARQEANDVGAIVSPEKLKAARQFKSELSGMQMILKGIGTTMALSVVPYLQKTLTAFKSWIFENRRWLQLRLNAIMEGLAQTLQRVWNGIMKLWEGVKRILGPFTKMSELFEDSEIWANLFTGALVALGMALLPLLAPLLKMIAIGTALSIVVEDLFAYFTGDAQSATGVLIDMFEQRFPRAFEAVKTAIEGIKGVFSWLWEAFKSTAAFAWEMIQEVAGPFEGLLDTVGDVFAKIANLMGGPEEVLNKLKKALEGIGAAFKWVFENIAVNAVKFAIGAIKSLWEGIGWLIDQMASLFGINTGKQSGPKTPAPWDRPDFMPAAKTLPENGLVTPSTAKVPGKAGAGQTTNIETNNNQRIDIHVDNAEQAARIAGMVGGFGAQLNSPGVAAPVAG